MNKDKVIECIQEYLMSLQSGKDGIPTLDDLQNAGLLHQFLENNTDVKFPVHNYFFVGVPEETVEEHYGMLLKFMDEYTLNPVMKFDKPDEYVYVDGDKKYILFAYAGK